MRKRIAVFLCMMMVFAMTTGVAMAMDYSGKVQCDANPYEHPEIGDASKFVAYGTNNLAYVTMKNTSGSSKYLTCQMGEYTANVGWTDSSSASGMEPNGIQISTRISRQTSVVGYYYHGGYCYNDQSCSWAIDDYLFKGCQRYYE